MLDHRFWSKVNKSGRGGCWEWTSCKNNMGYGLFSCRGLGLMQKQLAHRLSYAFHHGEIPHGAHILHACDNPSCVNPAHLSSGSRSDNMRDAVNKFRSGNQKVSNEVIRDIIEDYIAGMPRREIAEKYGVKPCTISDYTSGKSRKWADRPVSREEIQAAKQRRPGAKLTENDARLAKKLLSEGMTGRDIARQLGVHFATISDIRNGKSWKDV